MEYEPKKIAENNPFISEPFDITKNAIKELHKNLTNKLDQMIIQGLKNKGYEFAGRYELEKFIKQYCKCEEYLQTKQRVYFVKDVPFLVWNYEEKIDYDGLTQNPLTISASLGTYRYI